MIFREISGNTERREKKKIKRKKKGCSGQIITSSLAKQRRLNTCRHGKTEKKEEKRRN